MNDRAAQPTRQVIFDGSAVRLEYSGPEGRGMPDRVVVVLPPYDVPFHDDDGGWGSRSFAKRGIAHVCVFNASADWHQNDEFLPAMRACRAFLGPDVAITIYGFSMGAYGALLGAAALQADRAVAVSPQVSIDPAVVPFERRYDAEWSKLGRWQQDLAAEMTKGDREYLILFDPLHGRDKKHEALLPKPDGYRRCLMHGVGHGGLRAMVEMGLQECFFDLLRGRADLHDLRSAYRKARPRGFRYIRKMGNLLHERQSPQAVRYYDLARRNGFQRLINKWRALAAPDNPARRRTSRRTRLDLHVGLPKTGTTSFQTYLFQSYRRSVDGIWYPPLGQSREAPVQVALGQGLRGGKMDWLDKILTLGAAQVDRFLLSDENLFVEMPGVLSARQVRFRQIMARYDVRLVCVTREMANWKRSFYKQAVQMRRSGFRQPHPTANLLWQTPQNFADFFQQPYAARLCQTSDILDDIAYLIGAVDRVDLRYDDHADIVEALRSALDLKVPNDSSGLRRNPSLTDVQCEILRQANGQTPLDGRMVRALIDLDNGTALRPRIREKLLAWRDQYDWGSLAYAPNPPLDYTAAEFELKLDALKSQLARLT